MFESSFPGQILHSLNETHAYLLTQGKHGSRGKLKIIKLHGTIRKGCEKIWGNDYSCAGFMEDQNGVPTKDKEYTLYQPNADSDIKVDIAVLKNDFILHNDPVLAIFVKNVDHNYDQNARNYFKNQFAEIEMTMAQGVNCVQLSFIRVDGCYRTSGDKWERKADAKGKHKINGIRKMDLLHLFRDYESRKARIPKLGWQCNFDQFIIPTKLNQYDDTQVMYASFDDIKEGRDFKKRLRPGERDAFTRWAQVHTNPNYIWESINHIKEEYEKKH